jgi:GNAT superfamily N-acetyltransferase
MQELLNPKKNPFFEHSTADLFLAFRDNKIVGRIAAIQNNNYNKFAGTNVAYFGFFDVIEDFSVAQKLIETAINWAKEKGHIALYGPTNFSTNETAGILVDGFDMPPVINMTYNKPYYATFMEKMGFAKQMDLLAYKIPTQTVSEKSLRVAEMLEKRLNKRGITIRNVLLKNWDKEVKIIHQLYKDAWDKNWGFVPPTDKEFQHLADSLKMILVQEMVFLAEKDGKGIGFFLAVPNINEIMIKQKRGRILPFGALRLLFGKRKTKILRIILLGVVEEYRKLGIEAIFYAKIIRYAQQNGIHFGEGSWILENNEMMNKGLQNLNGEAYKRYRIFQKPI